MTLDRKSMALFGVQLFERKLARGKLYMLLYRAQ